MKLSLLFAGTTQAAATASRSKDIGFNVDFVRAETSINEPDMRQLKDYLTTRPRRRRKSRTLQLTSCVHGRYQFLCVNDRLTTVDDKDLDTTLKIED